MTEQWSNAIQDYIRHKTNLLTNYICELHFREEDIVGVTGQDKKITVQKNAIPKIFNQSVYHKHFRYFPYATKY